MSITQQGLIVAAMLALPPSPSVSPPAVGSPAVHPARAATLLVEQERLRGRFGPLALDAVARTATGRSRTALVQFLRAELVPYLSKEGAIVYPLTDSIASTGGYATAMATLEQDAIVRLVDCLDTGANSRDATEFTACAYKVSETLDAHFLKDQILTEQILENGLSERDMQRLVAEMAAPRMAMTR